MFTDASEALPGFSGGAAVKERAAAWRLPLEDGLVAEVLRGEQEIARQAQRLDNFIAGCGDAGVWGGAMVWLRDTVALHTVPCAVLLYRGEMPVAAALGAELTMHGWRTRLAMCGNLTGQRGFFTAAGKSLQERERMARAAADAMMASGVAALLFSLKDASASGAAEMKPGRESDRARSTWSSVAGLAQREVYDTFELGASYDESLSHLGPHTRRNLRYYRRRAAHELQCEFLPSMEGTLLRQAVVELQSCTDDPVQPGVAKNRIAQVARNPQAFCMGLRAADGRWLSWLSGWRIGRCTYIDWQCNRSGIARLSLSTVMRSYLIEQESLLGQSSIRFLGGTPHTMHYGFREERCEDWLLLRRGPWAALLRMASPGLRLARRLTKQSAARHTTPIAKRRTASHSAPLLQLLKRMAGVLMSRAKTQAK